MVSSASPLLTYLVCYAADIGRQEAAGALLVHLGTGGHTINGNHNSTPDGKAEAMINCVCAVLVGGGGAVAEAVSDMLGRTAR